MGTSLAVVAPLEQQYSLNGGQQLHMRLGGDHQLQNASLAVALAARWEATAGVGEAAQQRQKQLSAGVLPAPYVQGIQTCEWPGRSQVIGGAAHRRTLLRCAAACMLVHSAHCWIVFAWSLNNIIVQPR